jgi:hypothetical protein
MYVCLPYIPLAACAWCLQVLQFPDRQLQRLLHEREQQRQQAQPAGQPTLQPLSYCHWLRSINDGCIAAMLMHADAVAFLERSLTAEQAAPGPANTLYFDQWEAALAAERAADTTGTGLAALSSSGTSSSLFAARPSEPNAAAVVAAVGALGAPPPVLFLGAVPQLQDASGLADLPPEYGGCSPLRPDATFVNNGDGQARRQERLGGAQAAAAAR